jgi:indole-3-glycerol phosphate synthase
MTVLDKIIVQTREDLAKRKKRIAMRDFQDAEDYHRPRRSLKAALRGDDVRILAEIKKASPSKGLIREDFDPQRIAAQYQEGGASAISVLTDEPFFQGKGEYLTAVSREVTIPVLRKDFIVDVYQIEEAKAWGADAILLIATVLSATHLDELHHAAAEIGLECLVEAYDADDVAKIDFSRVDIFGVNNRDLRTFEVDVHRGVALLNTAPEHVVKVSESALTTRADIQYLRDHRIDAALIGEHFMRQVHPGEAVTDILIR